MGCSGTKTWSFEIVCKTPKAYVLHLFSIERFAMSKPFRALKLVVEKQYKPIALTRFPRGLKLHFKHHKTMT